MSSSSSSSSSAASSALQQQPTSPPSSSNTHDNNKTTTKKKKKKRVLKSSVNSKDGKIQTKALEVFKKGVLALEKQPQTSVTLCKAITWFTRVIYLTPNDVRSYCYRGECYLKLFDIRSALMDYRHAYHLKPNNVRVKARLAKVQLTRGQISLDDGDFATALNFFNEAVSLDRTEAANWLYRVKAHVGLKDYTQALKDLDKLLENEPIPEEIGTFEKGSELDAKLDMLVAHPKLSDERLLEIERYKQQKLMQRGESLTTLKQMRPTLNHDSSKTQLKQDKLQRTQRMKQMYKRMGRRIRTKKKKKQNSDEPSSSSSSSSYEDDDFDEEDDEEAQLRFQQEQDQQYALLSLPWEQLAVSEQDSNMKLDALGNAQRTPAEIKRDNDRKKRLLQHEKQLRKQQTQGKTQPNYLKHTTASKMKEKKIEEEQTFEASSTDEDHNSDDDFTIFLRFDVQLEAIIQRAKLYLLLDKAELAQRDIGWVHALAPLHPDVGSVMDELSQKSDYFFTNALGHILTKEYDTAISELKSAIGLFPYEIRFYDLRAKAYREVGQFDNALSDLRIALGICWQQHPPNLTEEEKTKRRIRAKAMERLGDDAAHLKYDGKSKPSEKNITVDRTDQIEKSLAETFNALGMEYFKREEYLPAIRCLNRSMQFDSSNANYFINRGDCYRVLQEHKRAASDYNHARRLRPNDRELNNRVSLMHNAIGRQYFNQAKYEEAEQEFSRAIELTKVIWQYYYFRGLSNLNLTKVALAYQDFERALKLAPGNAMVQQELHMLKNVLTRSTRKDNGITHAQLASSSSSSVRGKPQQQQQKQKKNEIDIKRAVSRVNIGISSEFVEF